MSKISRDKKKKKEAKLEKLGLLPKGHCESCGEEFLKKNLYYGFCPFTAEIYNENVETVLCKDCYEGALDDV